MRPLDKVVDAIINITPDDAINASFLNAIEKVKKDFFYTAPELWPMRWQQLGEACEKYLGRPDCEWKKTVEDVMTTKRDYNDFIDSHQRTK